MIECIGRGIVDDTFIKEYPRPQQQNRNENCDGYVNEVRSEFKEYGRKDLAIKYNNTRNAPPTISDVCPFLKPFLRKTDNLVVCIITVHPSEDMQIEWM